jgi:hypothetical protein
MYLIVGGGLVLIAAVTAGILLLQPAPKQAVIKPIIKPKPAPVYYAPLTGVKTASEDDLTKPVTAIMIENSPDARPQSGLKDAEVVYEAIAEGGITRFLALFQQAKPQLIGPVRSVRMYYVDWLTPYNASVAHVGGSYKALQLVRNGQYRDIDQFFNGGYYWRATDRYAPHNVYTSFSKLDALNKAKGYSSSQPKVFERRDEDKIAPKQNASRVDISISGPLYNSAYVYDPAKKLYARFEAGVPHRDREKGQITAKVVIAMKVTMSTVFEDGYRESIATTGKGTAYVFQDGHVSQVTWKKESRSSQLSFIDANGEPFKLLRGNTWITAIPNGEGNVTWK